MKCSAVAEPRAGWMGTGSHPGRVAGQRAQGKPVGGSLNAYSVAPKPTFSLKQYTARRVAGSALCVQLGGVVELIGFCRARFVRPATLQHAAQATN